MSIIRYSYLSFCALLSFIALLSSDAYSRTWYVRSDGSGDVPTIQAAIDSSIAGDSILVGPGTHYSAVPLYTERNDSLAFVGEMGSQSTFVSAFWINESNYITISGFTIENYQMGIVVSFSHHILIDNNIIRNTTGGPSNGNAINANAATELIVSNNLIYSCGSGFAFYDASDDIDVISNTISHCNGPGVYTDALNIRFRNNIITFNDKGVDAFMGIFTCNDVYGNTTNYSLLYMSDPTGANGNISVDPLFCGVDPATSGNYYIQKYSPCAPGNHEGGYYCELIGSYPVGCGDTDARETSWGRIKSLYRK